MPPVLPLTRLALCSQVNKNSMLEASARVPFILSGPGIAAGQRSTELASLHDIFPTVLDMAGVPITDADLAGESLLPVAKHGAQRRQSFVVAEYHSVFSGTGIFMIRDADLKLVVFGGELAGCFSWCVHPLIMMLWCCLKVRNRQGSSGQHSSST